MKVKTLKELTKNVMEAEGMVDTHNAKSIYTLADATAQLRKAKEELRIFTYKAKPSLSQNGKSLRP